MHAVWPIALIAGLVVGALAQRSRLCMAGGIRDAVMFRDFHLISGFLAIFAAALVGNLLIGSFQLTALVQPWPTMTISGASWAWRWQAGVPFCWAAARCGS